MLFTTGGRRNKGIHTGIGKAKANALLGKLYPSVVTKQELSNTEKLSIFKSGFVSILTYGHESWIKTERILSQVQMAETGVLRRVHGVTLRDKAHSCEIRKSLNVEPFVYELKIF